MLVTRVLGDCPACGSTNSFGNVSVGDHVLRGCKHCEFQAFAWLPPVEKKIVYLDQFFFSGAMRGNDPRFADAVALVRRLCGLQLLVAPFSSVHEDESQQWRGHAGMTSDQLMDFIKATARGAEFKKAYAVEHKQIYRSWEAFLKELPQPPLDQGDGISGRNITEWDDYFRIDVTGYFRDVEKKRELKSQSTDALIAALSEWRNSSEGFDDAVALELRDAGKQYLDAYIRMISRYAAGDVSAVLDTPMNATVVEQMMHWLPDDEALSERLKRCQSFFQSAYFSEVPHEWLWSHIFATFKAMVKRGAFSNSELARKRLNGFFGDLKHICTYAPYCDAIFVDKFMADLICRPTVNIEERYNVKVFSLSNFETFIAWLNALEANMSPEHREGVSDAYPGQYL